MKLNNSVKNLLAWLILVVSVIILYTAGRLSYGILDMPLRYYGDHVMCFLIGIMISLVLGTTAFVFYGAFKIILMIKIETNIKSKQTGEPITLCCASLVNTKSESHFFLDFTTHVQGIKKSLVEKLTEEHN